MSVSERLDELRAAVAECQLVAFIDLEARMVLSVSSQAKQPQEHLDALGESASRLLPMAPNALTKCLSFQDDHALPDFAVLMSDTNTHIFVRSSGEGHEALCCSCSRNAPVDTIIDKARAALSNAGDAE